MNPQLARRAGTLVAGSVLALAGLTAPAFATGDATSVLGHNPNAGCEPSHHSASGNGANRSGPTNPYQNTCEPPHEPGNGSETGRAVGQPNAGGVGNADDKYPPGQAPGGSDHNAGYECDRNQGVGKENPAHTSCSPTTALPPTSPPPPPTPVRCPNGQPMTVDTNGDGRLTPADCTTTGPGNSNPPTRCPNGQPMTVDTDGDGRLTPADCTTASIGEVVTSRPGNPDGAAAPTTDDVVVLSTGSGPPRAAIVPTADVGIGGPAEVLGVKLSRTGAEVVAANAEVAGSTAVSPAPLARTGSATSAAAALGLLLLMAGSSAVVLGRRPALER